MLEDEQPGTGISLPNIIRAFLRNDPRDWALALHQLQTVRRALFHRKIGIANAEFRLQAGIKPILAIVPDDKDLNTGYAFPGGILNENLNEGRGEIGIT